MFEIKKKEHVNKTFRIPRDLLIELERLAQESEVSLNNLIIQCCEYALQHKNDAC